MLAIEVVPLVGEVEAAIDSVGASMQIDPQNIPTTIPKTIVAVSMFVPAFTTTHFNK